MNNNYSPLKEMQLLAEGRVQDPFLNDLSGKIVDNQARLFLAAQARNELKRIIRLTEFLDSIEKKFMDVINKKLIEQPDNINLLMTSMDIITQSLKRSNELVNNVLNDNSLQTLVVNTVNLIPGSDNTSIVSRKSRDAIRVVASKLIEQLQQEEITDTEFIEVEDATKEKTDKEIAEAKIDELLSE